MSWEHLQPTDAHYGFSTYKNYLLSLSYLLDLMYESYGDISGHLKRFTRRSEINKDKIRALLMNSWNSELLLNFPGVFPRSFLKFSNHWAPVQSYYSIYLALRALIVAKGYDARGKHETTLSISSCSFVQQEKLFPPPWGVLLAAGGFAGLPEGTRIRRINPLENPDHFNRDQSKLLDSVCLFLKTTKDRVVEDKCQAWKDKNPTRRGPRKRLLPGVRNSITQRQRAVSLFDCFYRLRIRSNYKDVDIFLLGSSTGDSEKYFQAIRNVTDKTLFIIESYLSQYLGKGTMMEIVTDFEKADTLSIAQKLSFGVVGRYSYYA